MLRKRLTFGIALLLVMALMGTLAFAAPKKIVIKFPTVHGDPNALFNRGGAKIGEELEKLMPGVFDFQLYPGSSLGNEREILEGLRLGTIEMTTSGVAGIADPIYDVFDMPFLFRDRDHVYTVLDGPIGQELLEKCADKKLVALGYFENGWRHITNNKRPINTPSDLKGLKQRVVEHRIYLATMKALGANPVPIPYGELYTALKTGVVDGQDNPLANIWTAKFYEVQKYLTLSGHVYSNNVIFASKKWWDTLTPEQQNAIRKAVRAAEEYERKLSIEMDKELVRKLKEKGMIINEIKDKEPFIEATKSVYDQFSNVFPPELIKRIRETKSKHYPYTD
ncbi:MAG TPA: TRAP transporter substrate-binding protein [Firmicutes bacterium]|nr:TRAP transporter substrate-binding protein [Bacillota bacterium]